MRALHFPASLLLLALVPTSWLVQSDSLVGKTILMKGDKDPTVTADAQGQTIISAVLESFDYRVLADNMSRVQIETRDGRKLWLAKSDVILVDDAPAFFAQMIQQNAQSKFAYQARARAWMIQGKLELAIQDLTEAIRLGPKDALVYCNRGIAWQDKNKYDKAIADYSEAIRLDPKNAFAFDCRGTAYSDKKQHDKAIANFNEAIRLDPNNPRHLNNRGVAYSAKKEYDKAIADYSAAIRLAPKYNLAYFNRGNDWQDKKNYERAMSDYSEAIRLDTTDWRPLSALAWQLATCPEAKYRDGKKAVALAKKACDLSHWKIMICVGTLGAAKAEIGDFKAAIRYQKMALEDVDYARRDGKVANFCLELYCKRQPYRQGMEDQKPGPSVGSAPK